MIVLALRFPAGRYHATPWGRHVNEGEVEWPPSPWRLLRALLAVGFAKLGWTAVPPEGRTLIERLASVAPQYHLPKVVGLGHTRHYVPQFKGATSKVLDAFAFPGREEGAQIAVTWHVDPAGAELALFDDLARGLAYVGRAESWVLAERLTEVPEGLEACFEGEAAPGPRYERIPLLAPMTSQGYAQWKEVALAREKEGAAPAPAGRRGSKKGKDTAKLEELFPADLIDVLTAETSDLQRVGWSQPPGTRWLSYWRKDGTVTTTPSPSVGAHARPAVKGTRIDTALFALASDTKNSEVRPPLVQAVRRAEQVRAALMHFCPSPCFSGKDEGGHPLEGHAHAFILPISLNEAKAGDESRAHIDHVLVHASRGFGACEQEALSKLRRIYARGGRELYVTLIGTGAAADFARVVPSTRMGCVWQSATPFIPPRHLKARGRNALGGQVKQELASRGLPAAVCVEVEIEGGCYVSADKFWELWQQRRPSGVALAEAEAEKPTDGDDGAGAIANGTRAATATLARRWRHFVCRRTEDARRPPVEVGFGLRITLERAIRGPIALGYGAHFGLGHFVATAEEGG